MQLTNLNHQDIAYLNSGGGDFPLDELTGLLAGYAGQVRDVTAIHEKAKGGGGAYLRDTFKTPEYLYVDRLAASYEKYSGRRAAISFDPLTNEIYGPFVSFVHEATRHFCAGKKPPSGDMIRRALKARRERQEARQKV
jgi:hypothetical protein